MCWIDWWNPGQTKKDTTYNNLCNGSGLSRFTSPYVNNTRSLLVLARIAMLYTQADNKRYSRTGVTAAVHHMEGVVHDSLSTLYCLVLLWISFVQQDFFLSLLPFCILHCLASFEALTWLVRAVCHTSLSDRSRDSPRLIKFKFVFEFYVGLSQTGVTTCVAQVLHCTGKEANDSNEFQRLAYLHSSQLPQGNIYGQLRSRWDDCNLN
jgi:hypothetical protein